MVAEKEGNDEESVEEDRMGDLIARVWYEHGLFCASHPRLVIFLSAVVVLICSAPLFMWTGISATEEGRTTTMFPGNDSTIPPWFVGKPLFYVMQFVLAIKLKPWKPDLQSDEVLRKTLLPAFHITSTIMNYKDKQNDNSLSDMCLQVKSGPSIRQRSGLRLKDSQFLPSTGCLVLSPSNLWNRSLERFEEDYQVIDDLYQEHGRPAINIALKEFTFGIPLKQTGFYPHMKKGGDEHTVRYAVTLILNSHHPSYIQGLRKELEKSFPKGNNGTNNKEQFTSDQVIHIYYKGEGGSLVELGPISVAYFVVFLYLAFSVAKIDMVKSKWGLAFSAVITVMASLVMAAGLCAIFGIVPTLNSSEIFPYLVIMVGVENILVITKSVVSTPVDLDVKFRVAQGLSKEGRYMLKNLLFEILVLAMGYLTSVAAIQEFCLFALVGLLTDFFLQVFMFATILSIDIRRMELSDIQGILHRQRAASQGASVRILPPLPPASIKSPRGKCPVLPTKSKRLELAYFWARTRMVQRALMVCAVVYFLYMVFYSVPSTLDNVEDQTIPLEDESLLEKMIREALRDTDTEIKSKPDKGSSHHQNKRKAGYFDKPRDTTPWTRLSKNHWPQLMSYYNVSLVGRYISILPAVQLGLYIDTQSFSTAASERTNKQETLPTKSIPTELVEPGSGEEPDVLDPEYYLNALYCVLLGMLAMIVLFFVCKYLNDLQINPRAIGRRGRTRSNYEELTEALPMRLCSHPQSVEHVTCTLSGIVSICLSGQIRVWDRSTGECLRIIDRVGQDTRKTRHRLRSRSRSSAKTKITHDADFTTARYFESLANQDPHEQDNTELLSDSDALTSSGDHGVPISNTKNNLELTKELSGSVGSNTSAASGFDFSPYCSQDRSSPGIGNWPSGLSSSQSICSTWSSDEEGSDSLSETSVHEDEAHYGQVAARDAVVHTRSSAVWCLDCRGDILATGCSDGCVELWSMSSGRQICLYCENREGVTSVTFLPYSPKIVVARLDGTLDFLTLISPTSPHLDYSLDASPVKRSSPRTTRKSNTSESTSGVSSKSPLSAHAPPTMCSLTHRVRAHHQPVSVLVATEDRVVTGSHDRTLKVFRTDECVCVFTLHGHRDGITTLKVDTSNSDIVVSGASNGGVRVWDLSTGECLQHLRGHTSAITAITCTQSHMISVSIDNSMCIWDRATGKCLHYKLRQKPDLCSNVAMLSNYLFVTGGQGAIVIWDLLAGKQVKSVALGNGGSSVFIRSVMVCDTATVVCDYGKELRIVTFPFVINKAE